MTIQTPVLKLKPSEREYFVSRIRSGIYKVKINSLNLKIVQPTIEQELELNETYMEAYQLALSDDFRTEDQMLLWMREKDLWKDEDDKKIEGLNKDLEKLKVEIFNAKTNDKLKETIRMYLRAGESQLNKMYEKKNSYYSNTCEGVASAEKTYAFLRACTLLNGQVFDFEAASIDSVLSLYYSQILPEAHVRYLARTEPWRSLWVLNELKTFNLFNNTGKELSIDQRNLLIWSRMYDNVHESMDCPSEDIIEDDDMLDGWFIVQKQKRDKDKAEAELEASMKNSKIKNSPEVFMVAKSEKDIKKIESMNDVNAQMIKKEREKLIENKGEVSQLEFKDEKLRLGNMAREQFKDKFR